MKIKILISMFLIFVMTSLTDARVISSSTSDRTTLRKTVDVVVVVDKHAHRQWRQWQNGSTETERERQTEAAITQFVKATFLSANIIWQGMLEYGVALDLRIDEIRIVKDDDIVTQNADGSSVMNEVAFWDFYHWLVRNGFEFDHALLLTGLNLAGEDSSSHEGYAYMNTMCGTDSISLVENLINGIPAVVFAHEVGHSLSARHDGGGNNHCSSTSGYIMNANNIGTSRNHWNFSTCSARDINNKLQELTDSFDCLSEDSTRAPVVESPYLGQQYTGDQLCQMTHGSHSYVCRHLYNRPGSRDICEVLWCLVNATYCSGKAPVDGLPCGSGKRCLGGRCLPFPDVSPDVTDTCYTGDKPGLAWQDQTCGQVVGSYTHMCNDQWYKDFCCLTCQNVYTGNDACPYGDAHDRCAPYYCGTQWEGECCETCSRT